MEASGKPVAKARIEISEGERKRIADELGLDESEMGAVPDHLSIARYEDVGDDVSGFLFGEVSTTTQLSSSSLLQSSTLGLTSLRSGGILVPL